MSNRDLVALPPGTHAVNAPKPLNTSLRRQLDVAVNKLAGSGSFNHEDAPSLDLLDELRERLAGLTKLMTPATPAECKVRIIATYLLFPATSLMKDEAASARVAATMEALRDFPDWALEEMRQRVRDAHAGKEFPPAVPMLKSIVESIVGPWLVEIGQIEAVLAAPVLEPRDTPEHRAAVVERLWGAHPLKTGMPTTEEELQRREERRKQREAEFTAVNDRLIARDNYVVLGELPAPFTGLKITPTMAKEFRQMESARIKQTGTRGR